MKLTTYTLSEVCVGIFDCPHSTARDEGEGYPLIRTPNVGRGRLMLEGVHRVSQEVYNQRNARAIPRQGDLIFAREAPAGNVALIQEGEEVCLGQRTVLIRPNKEVVNSAFLAYYLLSPEAQFRLMGRANGATVAHVNLPIIRQLIVDLPSLEMQERIAAMLSHYDSLIENNRRQIKLLEEAAQRLYKEWFVDLRFPGHEHTPITNGIPQGWRGLSVEDVCETVGGGTPSTKHPEYYEKGTIPWVTPTDVTRNASLVLLSSEKCITQEGLANSSAKIVPPYSILMTSRASVGYFAVCSQPVCTNQGFIACVPKTGISHMFLLFHLLSRVPEIRLKAGGSTYPEISKSTFRQFALLVPRADVMKAFDDIVFPLIQLIETLAQQILRLTEARDRLLPKLMSGEVEV